MSSKKVVVVTGATGAQGGSVARYLLKDGTFAVRALTRNPDNAAARDLAAQGASVVHADFNDPATLSKAFTDAYGVFAVTNFWEEGVGAEGERKQGKALVDAAKAAGIQHVVWSTLDRTEFKPAHWESKADVDDYLKASGVPHTSFYTSFYFENFLSRRFFIKRPDGEVEYPVPIITDASFATYSVDDTGAWVLHAFKHPDMWVGKDMKVVAEFLSMDDMTKTINDVTGKKIHLSPVSPEVFQTLRNNPIPEELHDNMCALFKHNSPPFRDPILSADLHPGMKTFKAWVEENKVKLFD